jgi:Zn-dependent protease with chaperone function
MVGRLLGWMHWGVNRETLSITYLALALMLQAILAHELGHFHHKHIRQQMIISFLTSLLGLALLGYLITQSWFFNGLGIEKINNHVSVDALSR